MAIPPGSDYTGRCRFAWRSRLRTRLFSSSFRSINSLQNEAVAAIISVYSSMFFSAGLTGEWNNVFIRSLTSKRGRILG